MARTKTDLPGLYYNMGKCKVDPTTEEKIWYGRWTDPITNKKRGGNLGRETSDKMDMDDAYVKLISLRKGVGKTKTEERIEREDAALAMKAASLTGVWESYKNHYDVKKRKHHYEKAIFTADKGSFNKHILPCLGNKAPADMTAADVEKLAKSLQGKGLKPQTQKHVLALFKRMLKHSNTTHLVVDMPAVNNKVTEDLTPDELCTLVKVLDTWPDKLIADMMFFVMATDARQGEVRKLQFKDVDWHRNRITFRDRKAGDTLTIKMSNAARAILKRQIPSGTTPHKERFVFTRHGRKMGQVCRLTRQIRAAAGLPKEFRPMHGLRHWYLTEAATKTSNMEEVRKLAGHAMLSTTQRYLNAREDNLDKLVNDIGDVIDGAIQNGRGS